MHELINELRKVFEINADPVRAVEMSAYMKNNFSFYGLSSQKRRNIVKEVFSGLKPSNETELLELVTLMWEEKQREWHYTAIDLLAANKKLYSEKTATIWKTMILKHSWWDSIDGIVCNCITPWFKKFPNKRYSLLNEWESSANIWMQRVCIIHQLRLSTETDTEYLTHIILKNSDSKEFFIQKAIGWSLRQYAKTDPVWVKHFVNSHSLKALSRREALKNIN